MKQKTKIIGPLNIAWTKRKEKNEKKKEKGEIQL